MGKSLTTSETGLQHTGSGQWGQLAQDRHCLHKCMLNSGAHVPRPTMCSGTRISELRAVELLEGLCTSMSQYVLVSTK